MKERTLDRRIRQVVSQIVALSRPQKVILFGSAAVGRLGSANDLDFLVIMPDGARTNKVLDLLNVGVRDKPMPCDFLVATASQLKQHAAVQGTIYHEIVTHGREVYAA